MTRQTNNHFAVFQIVDIPYMTGDSVKTLMKINDPSNEHLSYEDAENWILGTDARRTEFTILQIFKKD